MDRREQRLRRALSDYAYARSKRSSVETMIRAGTLPGTYADRAQYLEDVVRLELREAVLMAEANGVRCE